MSLSIGPNIGIYSGTGAQRQADTSSRNATSGQSAPAGEQSGQAGRSQITDQIDITSITININQTTTPPNSNQLTVGVGRATAPLADGGGTPQPLAEGYFSSPTNFVPTGGGSGSSSATSEAGIKLQILNETTNTAQTQNGPSATGDSSAGTRSGQSDNSAYRAVNISV
jgi:hypothetical protein